MTSMRCKLRGKFIEVEIDLESFEPDPFPGRFPILFLVAGHEVGGYHNEGWLGDSYGLFQDLLLCTRDLLKCPESCFNKGKTLRAMVLSCYLIAMSADQYLT